MKVSVAKLIESAIFNDAECAGVDKWDMFEKKFWELFEGNSEYLESIQKDGITTPIMYWPNSNTVFDGHHRILCAWLLDIEFIEFTTEWYTAFDESVEEICLFD